MKLLIRGLIRFYQIVISRPLHFLCGPGSGCRFEPSCSHYFLQAVEIHGVFRGSWMGLKRIGRCNPWGPTGLDPVPKSSKKSPHDCSCHKSSPCELDPSSASVEASSKTTPPENRSTDSKDP